MATMGHRWKLPTMLHPEKGQANVCNKLTILKCDHCTLYIPHSLVLKRPIVFDVGHMNVIMVKSHRVASRRSYISSTCHFQVITSHPIRNYSLSDRARTENLEIHRRAVREHDSAGARRLSIGVWRLGV